MDYQQQCDALTDPYLVSTVHDNSGAHIQIFENEVPPFVELELEHLYKCVYSCLKKFRVCDNLKGAGAYVVRRGGKAVTIFIFRLHKARVQVMNELIKIDDGEIDLFAQIIFRKFKSVSVISFTAVQTDIGKSIHPFQEIHRSEDIVVALPSSTQMYLESLGTSTKRNIKRYSNKINKDFPSFQCRFLEKEEVAERHIQEILNLHFARMESQNEVSTAKSNEVAQMLTLLRDCNGFITIATINGRICGGLIVYSIGSGYFATVVAHDPDYNSYSLGTLCYYFTICECISRGCEEFHMLWGCGEYKYRFLGVQRNLKDVNMYRSSMHMIVNFRISLSSSVKAGVGRLKLWLRSPERRQSLMSRTARESLRFFKKLTNCARSFIH